MGDGLSNCTVTEALDFYASFLYVLSLINRVCHSAEGIYWDETRTPLACFILIYPALKRRNTVIFFGSKCMHWKKPNPNQTKKPNQNNSCNAPAVALHFPLRVGSLVTKINPIFKYSKSYHNKLWYFIRNVSKCGRANAVVCISQGSLWERLHPSHLPSLPFLALQHC